MFQSPENKICLKQEGRKTTFTSVAISDPLTCHKYFGKYTDDGGTILFCEQNDRGCAPYLLM